MDDSNDTDLDINTEEVALPLTVAIILFLFGLFGNLIVIITILKSKHLKFVKQGLIVSLSMADTMFLTLCFPLIVIAVISKKWPFSNEVCIFQGFIIVSVSQISICNLAAISINRYINICHSTIHKRIFSKKYVFILIMLAWIWGFFPTILGLPLDLTRILFNPKVDSCLYDWTYDSNFTIILTVYFLIPFIIILFCYLNIYYTFISSKKRVNLINQQNTKKIKKEDKKLVLQLFIVFISFVVCWYPYLSLAFYIDPYHNLPKYVYDITSNCIVLNSVINPPIYFFFNKILRKEAINIFMFGLVKQNVSTSNNSTIN